MLLKPFYGRMFFAPDGDGGSGGTGGAGGDSGDQGDGDQGGSAGGDSEDSSDEDAGTPPTAEQLKVLEQERDKAKADAKRVDRLLKDAQRRLAEFENADKSDEEKRAAELKALTDRADAAEQKLRSANAKAALTAAATAAKAIDPTAIVALVRESLEYDDDGEPTNVETVIAEARTRHPALFKAASGRGDGAEQDQSGDAEIEPGMSRLTHAYATNSKSSKKR
jgi:hypothetical protein